MEPHEKLDDAIYYAAQDAHERGLIDGNEWMTLVYQLLDGRHSYAQLQGTQSNQKTGGKFEVPKGAKIAAIVHNHPRDKRMGWNANQERFSPDDAMAAKQLRVPSYIAYGDDMRIAGMRPGGPTHGVNYGTPFDHIPEVKPAGQRLAAALSRVAATQ